MMFDSLHSIASEARPWWTRHRLALTILVLGALALAIASLPPPDQLTLVFCNVGQGDAILIQQGFHQLLVDSGRGIGALDCLDRHLPIIDRTIELALVTHPDTDHAGGFEQILTRYKLSHFVYNGSRGGSGSWRRLSAVLQQRQVPVSVVSRGDRLALGPAQLTVLWPPPPPSPSPPPADPAVLGWATPTDLNDHSIVLHLALDQFDALLTGDITADQERELIATELDPIELLKVAHHGSARSTSDSFLLALRPRVAIIQVGPNPYGHPAAAVLGRLERVGARVFRTDHHGDLVVTTDGSSWTVTPAN